MERQLKERLIGAAALVAAAVIMVPEMFSGPRESVAPEMDASRPTANQIKTYRVDLQSAQPAAVLATTVDPPAERPLDEAQAPQQRPEAPHAEVVAPAPAAIMEKTGKEPVVVVPPVKPAAKPASAKVADGKSPASGWAVQVGSFSAQDKARQIAADLKGQGFPAFVAPVEVNGKTLYRVRVGTMTDRASADKTLQKLRGNFPGASVVAPGR